jgi:hypothetical protein
MLSENCNEPLQRKLVAAKPEAERYSRSGTVPGLRSTAVEDLLTAPQRVQLRSSSERRDDRRTFEHWLRHASGDDHIPLLATFDFASIKRDWSNRFLICTDRHPESAAFVAYGSRFSELLSLPEKITAIIPLNQQIPERYRPLFAEGVPARFSGSFEHDFTAELFRAVFLPIRLHPSWSKWLIFGTFNCRTVLSVDNKGP